MWVLTAVKKHIFNDIIIENWIDKVIYSDCMVLDMRKYNLVSGKYFGKTKVVNLYDNKIGNECVW